MQRIIGTEVEYGISAPGDPTANPIMTSTQAVLAYAALLFYMGESFPPQVRGMGANVAHVMAPLGGIAGSGLLTILLTVGMDTGLAAIITGTGGLIVSALCMAGTRTIHDAHQKSTVFA